MCISLNYSINVLTHHVWPVDRPTKCHMKRCLEFKNNDISHMTFMQRPTCLLAMPFMCYIYIFLYVIYVRLRYYIFYKPML